MIFFLYSIHLLTVTVTKHSHLLLSSLCAKYRHSSLSFFLPANIFDKLILNLKGITIVRENINRCLLYQSIVETAEYCELSVRVRAHRNDFGGEFKNFN